MSHDSPVPTRAPALYIAAFVEEGDGTVVPFHFRLPCPPLWDDRQPGAWAAERRARRAYFAALDALRTGAVDAEEEAKAERLRRDLRSQTALTAVGHFHRVFELVHRRDGTPVVPTPPAPLRAAVITVPPGPGSIRPSELEARYRWTLDWLQARRFFVGKGLILDWRIRRVAARPGGHAGRGRTAPVGARR